MSLHWHFDTSLVLGVFGLTAAYLLGVGPLRRRYALASGVSRAQVVTFLLGVLVMYLALGSPLHDLSDTYLFSAHMVQHELIVLVVPPLLLAGAPGWLLRPSLDLPGVLPVVRTLTNPGMAFLVFNVVFGGWHYPALYEVAMRNHPVHIFEHLMFMAAGVIMWWPILSPLPELPRLPLLGQALYFVGQMFVCSALGAIITLPNTILYPWYAEAPRVWDLSPLADQQIGGVIMWAGGSFFFMVAAVVVFFVWAGQQQEEAAAESSLPSR